MEKKPITTGMSIKVGWWLILPTYRSLPPAQNALEKQRQGVILKVLFNKNASLANKRPAGLSKVAGCQRKWLPTWLVSASYSAWHFFTDGVF